jgi:hypothetical protein
VEALNLDAPSPRVLAILGALAALAFVLGALALHAMRRAWRAHVARARMSRALRGERRAEVLLRARGYEVIARQQSARWSIHVDGEPHWVELRADYLVRRGSQRLVAEVKTGKLAPRIETSATRRQLLEYRVAFDVDGVVLVDAEEGAVRTIEFPARAAPSRPALRLGWVLLGVAAGIALTLVVRGV